MKAYRSSIIQPVWFGDACSGALIHQDLAPSFVWYHHCTWVVVFYGKAVDGVTAGVGRFIMVLMLGKRERESGTN